MNLLKRLLLTVFLLVISSPFASATVVKTLNLKQLAQLSERIFRGQVVDIKTDIDREESGYVVRYYTFEVEECVAGPCSERITVKQLASKTPDYEVGGTYLVFQAGESERTGLSAPVGLWQGKYAVEKKNGRLVVPGLKKNKLLVKGLKASHVKSLTASAVAGAPLTDDYETFKAVIKGVLEDAK